MIPSKTADQATRGGAPTGATALGRLLLTSSLVLLLATPVLGQPNRWRKTPEAQAGFRGWQQSSYNPTRKTAVTFGGSVSTYQNDTWTTDLAAGVATQRRPQPDVPSPSNVVPCSRDGHNLVYVPLWNRHLLLNGWNGGIVTPTAYPECIRIHEGAAYDETTNSWERRPLENFPVARAAASMALHPDTGHVYLYGGGWAKTHFVIRIVRLELYSKPTTQGAWGRAVTLTPAGPHPPYLVNAENAMVWVPPIKKFLVLAGRGEAAWGAWLYDPEAGAGGTWESVRPSARGGVFPPYREFPAVAWEPMNQVVVLVGGSLHGTKQTIDDTWTWNPRTNEWTNLNTSLGVNEVSVWHHTLIARGDGTLWIVPQGAHQMQLDVRPVGAPRGHAPSVTGSSDPR